MRAIFAFALGPIGRYVVMAGAVVAALAWYRWDAVQDGAREATAKANTLMLGWIGAADRAAQGPQNCAGNWNREAGKCEP